MARWVSLRGGLIENQSRIGRGSKESLRRLWVFVDCGSGNVGYRGKDLKIAQRGYTHVWCRGSIRRLIPFVTNGTSGVVCRDAHTFEEGSHYKSIQGLDVLKKR